MKATRGHSHSSLFLMELILAILFFSIASGVCVQLFARAHTVSAGSTDLNRAVICAQSAADVVRTGGDLTESLSAVRSESDGSYVVYYASDWQAMPLLLTDTPPAHEMRVTFSDSGAGLTEAQIVVSTYRTEADRRAFRQENMQEIYRLTTAQYDPAAGKTEVAQ